jgi:hypothetical protein
LVGGLLGRRQKAEEKGKKEEGSSARGNVRDVAKVRQKVEGNMIIF